MLTSKRERQKNENKNKQKTDIRSCCIIHNFKNYGEDLKVYRKVKV